MALESPSRIEPTLLERVPPEVADRVTELRALAERLDARLHPRTAASLADLVRVMNCYYSNLIEGHNTRPRDIERALQNDLDSDVGRRDLQLEAKAHIRVQQLIDAQFLTGTLPEAASADFIRWLHREFYRDAPAPLLDINHGAQTVRLVPGEFRLLPEHEVDVGRHRPPSSAAVPAFMQYFEQRYSLARLGPAQRVIAMAAAHHRFNYVHPFIDGNGRVSRLMSHAMALHAGVGARGLWSISRGLARGLGSRLEYKQMMDAADAPREGDYDGRGNLSLRRLEEFVTWFLDVSLDQLKFMSELFDLAKLKERLEAVAQQRGLHPRAGAILDEVLVRGEMARGEASRVTGLADRAARGVLAELSSLGLLASESPKGPVALRFSVETAEVLFPRLFPQA